MAEVKKCEQTKSEAIEKAPVSCFECKHYKETDAEWQSGRCLLLNCQTFAEESCKRGEEIIKQINQWTADFLGVTTKELEKMKEELKKEQ